MNTFAFGRKTFGFILTYVSVAIAGWLVAWNQKALTDFIAEVGGIGNVVLAAVGLAAIVLSIFWPASWNEWIRRSLLLVIFGTLLFGGGGVFVAAFEQAPWITVLGILGVILVTAVLFGITILDHPVAAVRRLFQRRPAVQQPPQP